ncbi:MAG: hypothetical protein M0R17_02510 [Candidatus Omnitrophica bacterium]|jgi:hypothetical protein|nr:hypothetical protein [Candidatus Omnitrophota bacterium]
MNPILSTSGQCWILDAIKTKIDTISGVYVGLMTNYLPSERSYQTPFYINELSYITNSGYSRQVSNTWSVISGSNPYLLGSTVTFTISSGSWSNVYGYFVSSTNLNYSVLWSELFPYDKGSVVASGNNILITPKFYQY